ncbi:MAG: hypothetical protein IPF83_01690 [Rhodanobacteraceae bacterium]|nr:hypothetical protein [Rhodanobacteraceae bacterium]MBK7043742.1 hypothetical protein [Rhodanobacteraceae bacterium]
MWNVTWSDFASVATAVGVLFAAAQLELSKEQGVTAFEDSINQEYRVLAARLPTKALLGEELAETELAEHLDELYQYFDLCNGQIFLRQEGRISEKTWPFWCDGIHSNLKRPAFKAAWMHISSRANGDFDELRRLIEEGPKSDPRKWSKRRKT